MATKTVKINDKIQRIDLSEISKYRFSKKLVSHKAKVVNFLIENYLDIFDNETEINNLNRRNVAIEYLNQYETNDDSLLEEVTEFIDLFLVENYTKIHKPKRMGQFATGKIKEKPEAVNFQTSVQKRAKENIERNKIRVKKGMLSTADKELLKKNMEEIAKECGFFKYRDAIFKDMVNYIENSDAIFKIMLPWTSAGKSYAMKQIIYKYIFKFYNIIIATPNKCNLPDRKELISKLQEKYGVDNITESQIVMLDSVSDNIITKTSFLIELKDKVCVRDNIYTKDVDNKIENLLEEIKKFNENQNNKDNGYKAWLKENVGKAESAFRKSLSRMVFEDEYYYRQIKGKTRKEQVASLNAIKEFDILPQIFPQLNVYSAKIIIMSAMKMLYPIDMILFSHTNIVESDILTKNSLFILDEIDDIFVKFKEKVLSDATTQDKQIDVFAFLQTVYTYVNENKELYLDIDDEELLQKWDELYFQNLKRLSEEFCEKIKSHNILNGYRFKTEDKEDALVYMTSNHTFVTIGTNTKQKIVYDIDEKSKRILLTTKSEIEDEDKDGVELMEIINSYFDDVRSIIFQLAKEYYDYHESKKANVKRTYETALSSILDVITGKKEYAEDLSNKMFVEFINKMNTSNNNDVMNAINESSLSNAYSIYTFENDESHNESSILYCYFNQTSPEVTLFKILTKVKKCLCLSATGFLKSDKSNFNFDKIQKAREIFYQNDKKMLDMLKTENPFYISDEIINYKKAFDYQSDKIARKNVTVLSYQKLEPSQLKAMVDNIITLIKEIRDYKDIKCPKTFLSQFGNVLKTYIENPNGNPYQVARDLNQLFSILNSIKNKDRSILCIRNTTFEEKENKNKLYNWIKMLNNNVFTNKQIKFKSLVNLGEKVHNNFEINEEIKQNSISKIDSELKTFYTVDENSDDNTIIYVLFSSISTIATGVNPYQLIKEDAIDVSKDGENINKAFYAKIPDFDRFCDDVITTDDGKIFVKADFNSIYLEDRTHLKYIFDKNAKEERLCALYELNSVITGNPNISDELCSNMASDILSYNSNINYKKPFARNTLVSEYKILGQGTGRGERNVIGCKNCNIYIENSNVEYNGIKGFLGIIQNLDRKDFSYCNNASQITRTNIIDAIEKQLILNSDEHNNISVPTDSVFLKNLVSSNWDKREIKEVVKNRTLYNYLQSTHLLSRNITMTQSTYDIEKNKMINELGSDFADCFDKLYIPNPNEDGFTYQIDETNFIGAKWLSETNSGFYNQRFSKATLNLDAINCFFENHCKEKLHMNTSDTYIINPVLADFTKGDIAENAFEVLRDELWSIDNVKHLSKKYHELFDYTTEGDRYIDIKYWHTNQVENYIDRKHILHKLNYVSASDNSSVLLLNFYPSNPDTKNITFSTNGGKVQVINAIIGEDGTIIPQSLEKVKGFIKEKQK